MRHAECVWGGLKCHVIDRLPVGKTPRLGLVLCHGYGATGTDLVTVGGAILQVAPELTDSVQFLFPEGPVDMSALGLPGGRAWWPLNVQLLQQQLATRDFAAIRNVAPPGLARAGSQLSQAIAEWQAESGLAAHQIVPGGFSQGAMVTLEITASAPDAFAGAVLLSGTLLNADAWSEGLKNKPGLPIFQSHGLYDFVLPFAAAQWLRDLLEESGSRVRFVEFDGGHEIPWEVLEELAEFLRQRLT